MPSHRCHRTPPPPRAATAAGFTLIELLVVVGIIAVLASLLLPAIGLVRKAAAKTRAMHAVRQLGMGTIAYSTDNEGLLPGPLYANLATIYNQNQPFYIGYYIWSYLDAPTPATGTQELTALRDVFRERSGGFTAFSSGKTYWSRNRWFYPGGDTSVANPGNLTSVSFDPCGYYGATAANQKLQHSISEITHQSVCVCAQDPSSTNYSGDPALPAKPFYGSYVTLYWDNHVGTTATAFPQPARLW